MVSVQTPLQQPWLALQACPQAPQLLKSLWRSMQALPQRTVTLGQVRHAPLPQTWLSAHTRPQTPQFCRSEGTQTVPQQSSPRDCRQFSFPAQPGIQWLFAQWKPGGQQSPSQQLSPSVEWQQLRPCIPRQSVCPGKQVTPAGTQLPLSQIWLAARQF
jgi:hypothetical protein